MLELYCKNSWMCWSLPLVHCSSSLAFSSDVLVLWRLCLVTITSLASLPFYDITLLISLGVLCNYYIYFVYLPLICFSSLPHQNISPNTPGTLLITIFLRLVVALNNTDSQIFTNWVSPALLSGLFSFSSSAHIVRELVPSWGHLFCCLWLWLLESAFFNWTDALLVSTD